MSEVEQLRAEVARLQARVKVLREGGPASRDLGYVFVMTYGRSGSTLLMGLLNTIPGYLIRGENDDALRFLHDFHQTCVERSRFWPVERMRMQLVSVSPGLAAESASIAVPESLSSIATVPAASELPVFVVVAVNAE